MGVVVFDEQGGCTLANAAARALGDRAVHALAAAAGSSREAAHVEAIGDRVVEVRTHPIAEDHGSFTLTTVTDVTRHHIQRELLGDDHQGLHRRPDRASQPDDV